MTWSAVRRRSSTGLSWMNIRAVLRAPPPPNARTLSTAGSFWMIATYCFSLSASGPKETSWAACSEPMSRPVSCWGKKPLGTITNR
jgi:hypothetical protein